jgi:hypothetical protein
MVERYGVEHPLHSDELMDKKANTNLEKYGARSPMQNTEIRKKCQHRGFRVKQYTFPSGRIVDCQGYEPFAYDILLQEVQEDDILVESDIAERDDIPEFWYEYEGKTHRYYPDICIWSQKKIIEVKSEWTAGFKPEVLELKRQSVLANDFAYEMWILDNRGVLINRTQ